MTDSTQKALKPCPFCRASAFTSWDGDVNAPNDWSVNCDNTVQCGATVGGMSSEAEAIKAWNSRASVVAVEGDAIRLIAAESVAHAARQFCEELQEDAEGVPQLQLAKLNKALDAWEAYPDARKSFDDSQPVMAALASLIEDEHATDHQRRVARLALTALESRRDSRLTEPERNEVCRAIAESDIAGCALENTDIDALVDLFESWLERRAAASSPAPAEVPPSDEGEQAIAKLREWTDPERPLPQVDYVGSCASCGVKENYTYHVPENLWRKIVPEKWWNEVVCAGCFHRLATTPAEPEGKQGLSFSERCHTEHTPPETPAAAMRAAREWMNTHHASFKTNKEREEALAAIITRHLVEAAPVGQEGLIDAFRDTAIKVHMGYRHEGPWEECEWIECEDRRNMIAAATTSPETPFRDDPTWDSFQRNIEDYSTHIDAIERAAPIAGTDDNEEG